MTLREKLSGAIAPLFTPFTDEGEVDHDSLRRMVRWQLANGSIGVSIGGSTGEPSAQTIEERAAAIRTISSELAGTDAAFVPGTGSAKLEETLELTAIAQEVGVEVGREATLIRGGPRTLPGTDRHAGSLARPDRTRLITNQRTRTATTAMTIFWKTPA